jgi:hypothetical protein
VKVLALRRPDRCHTCGAELAVGTKAGWDAVNRVVHCLACMPVTQAGEVSSASAAVTTTFPRVETADEVQVLAAEPEAAPTIAVSSMPAAVSALAGSSAQREYDRRSQRRDAAIRSRHPRLGGLLLALTNEPTSTRVWAQGAQGERAVAAKLDELSSDHAIALHDRRMLRPDGRASKANIDHLVVTPAGVWVVDAKTHQGTLEVRRTGGLFSPRVEKLFINGRDKSGLLDGLRKQVDAVRETLTSADAAIPVRGALCFVGTELPWFGETIAGVPLVGRRGLVKLMKQPGTLGSDEREAIAQYLDHRFVPA